VVNLLDKFALIQKNELLLSKASDTIKKAKSLGIDQIEIYGAFAEELSASIEKNDWNTCSSTEEVQIGVRVISKGKQGFATTNQIENLDELVREAKILADQQSQIDDALVLPFPEKLEPLHSMYHDNIDNLELKDIIDHTKQILKWRNDFGGNVSLDTADVSLYKGFKFIVNSNGCTASELGAGVSGSFMGMAIQGNEVGSFDYDSYSSQSPENFSEELLHKYKRFLSKCRGSLGAISIPSLKAKVLLPPQAIFSFFLGSFLGSLSATSIRKGKSKMANSLNQKVASSLLNVYDNPRLEGRDGSTHFDREGQSTRIRPILEKGHLHSFFYNTYEAKKAGLSSSLGGSTGGSGGTPGCGVRQILIKNGISSLKEMLLSDEKKILVNRFSGTTNSVSGEFSGVIKGGFLLEGESKTAIKEIQIAGNVFDLMNQVLEISQETEILGNSHEFPYLIFDKMDFIGKS
jgi:PmbA protein